MTWLYGIVKLDHRLYCSSFFPFPRNSFPQTVYHSDNRVIDVIIVLGVTRLFGQSYQ